MLSLAAAGCDSRVGADEPLESSGGSGGKGGGGASSGAGGKATGGSSAAGSANAGSGGSGGSGGTGTMPAGNGSAADVAEKLGRKTNFMIGLGNMLADSRENDTAYHLGVTLDLHYLYLVGLPGQGGWTDWNENGAYATYHMQACDQHGVVPMFTMYQMAAWGEQNIWIFENDDFMAPFWQAYRMLYQRINEFGKPVVVHFEPDFWGYVQQHANNHDPAQVPAHVGSLVPECSDLPSNAIGIGKCMVRLARQLAPKAIVGMHASAWGGEQADVIQTMNLMGASEADVIFVETLDRDAGCFEAAVLSQCQRAGSGWYWNDSDFANHLSWVNAISSGLGLPVVWWQMPMGVPADSPGMPDHYRDNRVQYLFSHVQQFVDAGGLGAAFGPGSGGQTTPYTDNGQFQNAITGYYQNPTGLP